MRDVRETCVSECRMQNALATRVLARQSHTRLGRAHSVDATRARRDRWLKRSQLENARDEDDSAARQARGGGALAADADADADADACGAVLGGR